MSKITKNPVRILKLSEYKGYHILIQQIIPQHIFQFIIAKDGNFWQGFNTIVPNQGFTKRHEEDDVLKAALLTLDQAFATVEALINPDLLKDNERGEEVLKILEQANKNDDGLVQKLPN